MPPPYPDIYYDIAAEAKKDPCAAEILSRIRKFASLHRDTAYKHGEITHLVLQEIHRETAVLLQQPVYGFIGNREQTKAMHALTAKYLGISETEGDAEPGIPSLVPALKR